ncbi:unnamed protein product [Lactuca saligna]|uniref:Uncharacterized protein n=1 Tax=Lactuca saligna TaxID=75948 RepID=A0AA36DZ50_LACSI|nr:unnamed protein product [Lactuca saligna]
MVVNQSEAMNNDQPNLEADDDHVIYLEAYSEGKILQGIHNGIEFDDDQLNPRKSMASFSRGANDDEAGRSSVVGSSSAPSPSKKTNLRVDLEYLTKK